MGLPPDLALGMLLGASRMSLRPRLGWTVAVLHAVCASPAACSMMLAGYARHCRWDLVAQLSFLEWGAGQGAARILLPDMGTGTACDCTACCNVGGSSGFEGNCG